MVIRVKLQLMLEIEKQTYLLFKRGRHDHNVLACSSKSLQYCVEGLEFELEDYPKEEESHNEDGLSEKCHYYERRIGNVLTSSLILLAKENYVL